MPFLSKFSFAPEFEILWKELRKRRGVLAIGVITSIVASGISAVIPYLYGRLTDITLREKGPLHIIGLILALWLLLDVLQAILGRLVGRIATRISFEIWGDLTVSTARHLLDLPLSYHRDRKMGEVLTKITRGIGQSWEVFDDVVFSLGPDVIALIAALIISFFVEWRMAIVLTATLIVYTIVSLRLIRPIIKKEPLEHRAWERADGSLWEAVLNVETVKSYTAEQFEHKRLRREFQRAGILQETVIGLWQNLNFWDGIIFAFGFVAVFAVGVLLLRQSMLSPGKLIMFIGYMNLALAPLSRIANYYRRIRRASSGLKRSLSVFKVNPEMDRRGAKDIGPIRGVVIFDNVSFRYGNKQPVLKNISFKVNPGEVVAFVGESGVGKTTLANLILRYWLPTEGKIYIDGKETSTIVYASLRKQIAVVPQEILLFNDTVKSNIRYGRPDATDEEIIAAAKAANAHGFIEKFPKQYRQRVGERGIRLSAGQKQRIAIARAILRNPRILILDEATAALDSASEKLVQEALERLIRGKTTFIVAHRLSTIAKADKIIVLEKGTIAEIGTHRELLEKEGLYAKFWQLQTSLGREIFDEKTKVT